MHEQSLFLSTRLLLITSATGYSKSSMQLGRAAQNDMEGEGGGGGFKTLNPQDLPLKLVACTTYLMLLF